MYLATDQVRFYPIDAPFNYGHGYGGGYTTGWGENRIVEPIPLDRVKPLVFSEIMRDVDMFVGVCSIGNDPNWADTGAKATTITGTAILSAICRRRRKHARNSGKAHPAFENRPEMLVCRQIPGGQGRVANLQNPSRER
jgi:hypothetical protein